MGAMCDAMDVKEGGDVIDTDAVTNITDGVIAAYDAHTKRRVLIADPDGAWFAVEHLTIVGPSVFRCYPVTGTRLAPGVTRFTMLT